MSLYGTEGIGLGVLVLLSIVLSVVILGLSFLVGPSVNEVEKLVSFECGFDAFEDSRKAFDVKFYLVSLLFLVFDLETIFFFPWSVTFSTIHADGFVCMIDFLVELLLGYVFAYRVGALSWTNW